MAQSHPVAQEPVNYYEVAKKYLEGTTRFSFNGAELACRNAHKRVHRAYPTSSTYEGVIREAILRAWNDLHPEDPR